MKDRYVFLLDSVIEENPSGCLVDSYLGAGEASEAPGALMLKCREGKTLRIPTGIRKGPAILTYRWKHYDRASNVKEGSGAVGDFLLTKRIIDYLLTLHGKKQTNCLSMAEYLRTGVFHTPDNTTNGFHLTGHWNTYHGQKITLGDTVFLMMFSERARGRSAGELLYKHRRERRDYGSEWGEMRLPARCYTGKELLDWYFSGLFRGFHAMTCIGVINGEPLFIHQAGLNIPGDKRRTGKVVIHAGHTSPGDKEIAWVLVQKRKRR